MSSLLSSSLGEKISSLPFASSHHAVLTGSLYVLSLVTIIAAAAYFCRPVRDALVFMNSCFLQPIGKVANQGERLDRFYQKQASVYDSTRSGLLRGRKTMLQLCAAQLREVRNNNPDKELVWVDIGGGTGWNIEQMAETMPLSEFSAIYLIDLCEPLLEVARKRFAAKGLKNVHVLCQDARDFQLPGLRDDQKVDLFTCSYSLSMIPPFYATLDRINDFLEPDTGVFGVVDFYVSGSSSLSDRAAMVGGDTSRQVGFFSRLFWSNWFDFDHIELHPARRDYLEYKFGTIKCYNGRNHFILPGIVRIPYYIWLGCSRSRDTTAAIQAFEIEAGNRVICPPSFPELSFAHLLQNGAITQTGELGNSSSASVVSDTSGLVRRRGSEGRGWTTSSDQSSERAVKLELGPALPLSSFHYQKRQWRLPFVDNEFSSMFRTWIYGFTWEDPYVDMEHLNLGKDDSILCITSAGDNALHYAIAGQPKRIHAVDMNPCQGHLLELKLAAIASLEYEEFWSMFGEGKCDNFRELLDKKISPYLSSHAYQFWRLNHKSFDKAFYFRGYSGHALRLAKIAFTLNRANKDVKAACEAKTIEEQQAIWDRKLRGTLINKTLIRFFFANPAFLWNALGVPVNQFDCFRKEGVSVEQFAIDTMDSIPGRSLFRTDNYHYLLCLLAKYTRESCPLYLKPEAFKKLKENSSELLDSFRLHTNSIVNVLRGLEDGSLTRAITMDHMDWFDPVADSVPAPTIEAARKDDDKSISDLDREIIELSRVIRKGGSVFWRSAAKVPWYNQRFQKMGFEVQAVHIRETGKAIDNVNMYASFYKATRL